MKIIFLFNSKSGTVLKSPGLINRITSLIREKLSESDQLEIFDVQNTDEAKVIRDMKLDAEDRIFIAGGDGTISSVLNSIIDLKVPVGVLPLGTFNNFSKSLKLSSDIDESIKQIFDGKIINIDLAKVNGRVIINNSSVGIYPKLVSLREESQVDLKLSKPAAMFVAFVKAVFLFPLIKVVLSSDNSDIKVKTSFVMVSNNKYIMDLNKIGERESLTEGLLYVYLIRCRSRLCVIKVLFKALMNKLNQEKDFELIPTKKVEVKMHKKYIEVAADGEVFKQSPPLRYQICPGCLKIIVPNDYEQ